jgi:hypothetical protein
MTANMVRAIAQAAIAIIAIGGGIAFALVAQSQGHSPEPPTWITLIIGGAVTYFYAATSHQNGQTAAIQAVAQTMAARRAGDPPSTTGAVDGPSPPSATTGA